AICSVISVSACEGHHIEAQGRERPRMPTRPRRSTSMTTVKGVILQATYRVATQQGGRRIPVVHLYGRLEDGGTFLVRDDRQTRHFYIHSSDAAQARQLGAREPKAVGKHDFAGAPVSRIDVGIPADVPALRDRIQANGVDTFEADVRFPIRYLIQRGIKGACEIDGIPITGAVS